MKVLLAACCAFALLACDSGEAPEPEIERVVEATAAEHVDDTPAPSPLADAPPARPVLEQDLAYGEAEGHNLVGYLAMPADAAEPLPGLILVHEWWGLNDNIKSMARQLAAQGYVALATDMYAGEVAANAAEAEALMTRTMRAHEAALANIQQAYEYLDRYALAPRIGVIGWCLGGGLALQTALMLPDELDAAVMFYGQPVTDAARLAPLETPLLGLFGAEDSSIPVRDVQRFRTALRDLGKQAEVLIYSNAGHAFANPSGGNYDAAAAEEAWSKTLEFLKMNL